jgi:hypothetical protein
MTSKLPVLCDACLHLRKNGFSCPAYPDRIPEDIRTWGDDHREIRPDQTGDTVFEIKDTDEARAVFEAWSSLLPS